MQPVVVHGLSVCLLVMTMSSAKMAELIGIGTQGAQGTIWKPVSPTGMGTFAGHTWACTDLLYRFALFLF